jgi:hypothetical protein
VAGVSSLGSAWTTTAGDKTVTATPSVGDLIIIVAPATGVATSAVSDNNADGAGTYVKIGSSFTGWSTAGDLSMWVRTARIGSATSTVFTATQTSSTGGGLNVFGIFGMTRAGLNAIKQFAGQSTGTAGTGPAPTFAAAPDTNNAIIGAVCNAATVAGSVMVNPIGWTEAVDLVYSTPAAGLETTYQISGVTTPTITWGGNSGTAFGSMVIELDASTPTGPYLVASYLTSITALNNNSLVSPSFTPATGELLVVKAASSDFNQALFAPTNTGFTVGQWLQRVVNGTGGASTRTALWTGVVTSGGTAGTVTVTASGTLLPHSMVVERWANAQLAASPVLASTSNDTISPWTTAISTAAAGSVISYICADWSAQAPATVAYAGDTQPPTPQHTPVNVASQYTAYYLYQAAPSAGSNTIGLSAPASQNVNTAGIEIQATGGAAPSPPPKVLASRLILPHRRRRTRARFGG